MKRSQSVALASVSLLAGACDGAPDPDRFQYERERPGPVTCRRPEDFHRPECRRPAPTSGTAVIVAHVRQPTLNFHAVNGAVIRPLAASGSRFATVSRGGFGFTGRSIAVSSSGG